MPGTSLLALLDDISSILDDVAVLTKVATAKTVGVLGDDLALNAHQISGIRAERELPVVWAVARGSLVNKAILVPAALAISAWTPWAVTPLLMVGGGYLCFEGFEKVLHTIHRKHVGEAVPIEHDQFTPPIDAGRRAAFEREKIKGAVRTDFILSAEIVTIALGSVSGVPLLTRVLVLSLIAVLMTAGVYGLVGVIVKLDDFGLYLCSGAKGRLRQELGVAILRLAPRLLKSLTVVGTLAMFLVGGGIVAHGLPWIHALEGLVHSRLASLGWLAQTLAVAIGNLLVGFIVGLCVWAVLVAKRRLLRAW